MTKFEEALCERIEAICNYSGNPPTSEENIQLALCFDGDNSIEESYKKVISSDENGDSRQRQTALAFEELCCKEKFELFNLANINERFPAQYIKTNIVKSDIGDEDKFSNLALFNKTITPDTFPLSPDIVYTIDDASCILEVKYPHSNGHKWLYSTGFIEIEKNECKPINGFTSKKPFCAPFLESGGRNHVMGMKNEGSMITDLIRLLHMNDALKKTGVNACLYFTTFFKCNDIKRCGSNDPTSAILAVGERLAEILRFYKVTEFCQCVTLSTVGNT